MYVCVRVSDLGVTDSCELPCGCWELNPGPREEQSVLLTTEPSLHSNYFKETEMKKVVILFIMTKI
ncbi:hypothetical protein LEMLEM_LOCUS16128 [Lemmus lemmus]